MRKVDLFLSITAALILIFIFLVSFQPPLRADHDARFIQERALVKEHGLTDLCLFTEARYTRHLSQADWHAPFQDHPFSIEHYPSGSLVAPPPRLMNRDR